MNTTAATLPAHVRLDESGRAWIDDTNVKVIEVVCDKLGYGWSAEEIKDQYPDLSLAQVYAALAYYYDHMNEFDAEISRQVQEYERSRDQAPDSPLRKKLRDMGKIS